VLGKRRGRIGGVRDRSREPESAIAHMSLPLVVAGIGETSGSASRHGRARRISSRGVLLTGACLAGREQTLVGGDIVSPASMMRSRGASAWCRDATRGARSIAFAVPGR
jgi:hypothetical protein